VAGPDELKAARRLAAVREQMAAERLDALLVCDAVNLRWLSGYVGEGVVGLLTRRWAGLLATFRNVQRARRQATGWDVIDLKARPKALPNELRRRRVEALGVEASTPHAAFAQRRKALRPVRLRPSDAVRRCRAVKTPEEIDLLRRAQRRAEAVFERVLGEIRPGMTEHELHNRIIQLILDEPDLDGPAFPPICASGPSAWATHSYYTRRRLRANDCLILDLGVRYRGWCSDMTRTVFLGRPTRAMREVYAVVLEAQQRAIEAIRPGVRGAAVHAAAHEVLVAHGYGESMGHGLGHGIGMEVHEHPAGGLGAGSKAPLREGMVLTVEPGIYLPGRFGVRIEDTVVVTPTGCEDLTRADRSIVILP